MSLQLPIQKEVAVFIPQLSLQWICWLDLSLSSVSFQVSFYQCWWLCKLLKKDFPKLCLQQGQLLSLLSAYRDQSMIYLRVQQFLSNHKKFQFLHPNSPKHNEPSRHLDVVCTLLLILEYHIFQRISWILPWNRLKSHCR